jgi:hypothetical protein
VGLLRRDWRKVGLAILAEERGVVKGQEAWNELLAYKLS